VPPTKYGKYISREIIEESKYPQVTAPMVKYRGDRGGRDCTFEWSCITKPLVIAMDILTGCPKSPVEK
jgi:hypothetical protein